MPQPARIPSVYALIRLILRIITLLLSIIALIFLIYISVRYSKSFAVAYAAVIPPSLPSHCLCPTNITQALFAFILDTSKIITLTDRRRIIPQAPPLLMMVLELGALGLLAGGCATLAYADLTEPGRDKARYSFRMDPWRIYAFYMQVVLG